MTKSTHFVRRFIENAHVNFISIIRCLVCFHIQACQHFILGSPLSSGSIVGNAVAAYSTLPHPIYSPFNLGLSFGFR